MRCLPKDVRLLVASAVLALGGVATFAQGPGGPGMPMQRQGPSRSGAAAGVGSPGMPMGRLGKTGGGFSTAAPARRNYGVGTGVTSSQNYRASSLASQARGGGMQRSSSAIISGATRGAATLPSSSR